MTAAAIRDAARRMQLRDPVPVCSGCPSGQFETQCDDWMRRLAESVSTTAERFVIHYLDTGDGAFFGLRSMQRPDVLAVARVVPHPGGGRTLAVLDETEIEKAPPPEVNPDVDRIGQLLEGQARLEAQFADLRNEFKLRDITALERVQRLILLMSHYGEAPWIGTITGSVWKLFGYSRVVSFEREKAPVGGKR